VSSATSQPSTKSTGSTARNVRSIFYYAAFYPGVELVSAWPSLILWVGGGWVAATTV
jgi:hypothetical protein